MYKLKGGLPYDTDCFSYWQGTIQASYAVMRQLLFHKILCCGYAFESPRQSPHRGDSNEHPQHRFLAHLSGSLIGELIGYSWSGVRPSVVRPFTMLKDLLLQNRLANQSQILCGASLGRGNDILFTASGSHDQDGRHAHIWSKPLKNLLQNRWVDFHKTWYVASGTPANYSLFK